MSTNKNLYTLFFSTFDKFCACHNIINVKVKFFEYKLILFLSYIFKNRYL